MTGIGPVAVRQPRVRTDQLATLIGFLLLAYFALTAAGVFAFTFIW